MARDPAAFDGVPALLAASWFTQDGGRNDRGHRAAGLHAVVTDLCNEALCIAARAALRSSGAPSEAVAQLPLYTALVSETLSWQTEWLDGEAITPPGET